MHDSMAYLANLFAHEHVKFHYVHESDPDDPMFRGATNFQEAMSKITDPDTKSHLYKYQKGLKIRVLHERGDKLKIKQDLQKEKNEKEAREQEASSISILASQTKDKGKGILDGPPNNHLVSMEDTLQKWEEFKRNLEKINS